MIEGALFSIVVSAIANMDSAFSSVHISPYHPALNTHLLLKRLKHIEKILHAVDRY